MLCIDTETNTAGRAVVIETCQPTHALKGKQAHTVYYRSIVRAGREGSVSGTVRASCLKNAALAEAMYTSLVLHSCYK